MTLNKRTIWTGMAGVLAASLALIPLPGSAEPTGGSAGDPGPAVPLTSATPESTQAATAEALPSGVTSSYTPPPGCKLKRPAKVKKNGKTKPSKIKCKDKWK